MSSTSSSRTQLLPMAIAAAALVARPLDQLGALAEAVERAHELDLCVELDGWSVPLATASAALLGKLESSSRVRHPPRSLPVLSASSKTLQVAGEPATQGRTPND